MNLKNIVNNQETPICSWDQIKLENSLINIYKTIEAVIGDIPKDVKKYFCKLNQIGINPLEIIGFRHKEIYKIIKDVQISRDKKAAHGKTPDRRINYIDLVEYQMCARYILFSAIEKQLGEKL